MMGMFCKRCGKELKESASFCGSCGEPVLRQQEQEKSFDEPQAEAVNNSIPGTPTVNLDEEQPVVPKKKRKLKKRWFVLGGAVLVLILGFIFREQIMNTVLAFGPAKTQFQYVYKNAVDDFTDDFADTYASVLANSMKDQTVSGKMEIAIDDSIAQMLYTQTGMDVSSLSVDYESTKNGNKQGSTFVIGSEGQAILSAEICVDLDNNYMTMAFPELNETPIAVELDDEMIQSMQMSYMIMDILPDSDLFRESLPTYLEAAFKEISKVERTSKTLNAGGVSQKSKCLVATIDGETLQDMVVAVLREHKTDKVFKKYFESTVAELESVTGQSLGMSGSEAYAMYTAMLDELISEVNSAEMGGSGALILSTWINSKGDIIAIEIADSYDTVSVLIAKAQKGKNVGYEISATAQGEEVFSLAGSGKENDGKFTGELSLNVNGMEDLLVLEFDQFDFSVLNEGGWNGSLKVKIPAESLEMMTGEYLGTSMMISLDGKTTKDSSELKIGFGVGNLEMFSISVSGNQEKLKEVSVHPGATTDIEAWSYGVDFNALIDNLEAIGIPSELLEEMMGY